MTIEPHQAANLATRYHDAMIMVSNQSTFHLPPNTSPRQCLAGYLQACKVCGVRLHNDSWEERAEIVVDKLSADRRAAWAKLLRGGKA